jgi:pimeloyl-ACP methyl ester carboxylesterase
MSRPRLLLVPEFTELEWDAIRPHLEEWAEVASYDPPGVGDEPRAARLDRRAIVERGMAELDRLGWERYFLATDSWGIPSALRVALARPDAVLGVALGHAKLSHRRDGERAPINGAVYEALRELIRTDHEAFIRHGIAQATGGSISEDLAERMIERFPHDLLIDGWETITGNDADVGELIARLDCPLLFANHVGCLASTQEGFDDAAAAFPQARIVAVEDAPLSSFEFAEALRRFCEEVNAPADTAEARGRASGDAPEARRL